MALIPDNYDPPTLFDWEADDSMTLGFTIGDYPGNPSTYPYYGVPMPIIPEIPGVTFYSPTSPTPNDIVIHNEYRGYTDSTELARQRKVLDDGFRENGYYPDAPHPADCYILESAGIDPEAVASGGVMPMGYMRIVRTEWRPDHPPQGRTEYTSFTPEQIEVIKDWWDLISPETRGFKNKVDLLGGPLIKLQRGGTISYTPDYLKAYVSDEYKTLNQMQAYLR